MTSSDGTSGGAATLNYAPVASSLCPDLILARQFTGWAGALAVPSLSILLGIMFSSGGLTQSAGVLLILCVANTVGWSFAVGALLVSPIWWATWIVVALLSCFWLVLLGAAIWHIVIFIAGGAWLAFPF
jgi:hypothetical protein